MALPNRRLSLITVIQHAAKSAIFPGKTLLLQLRPGGNLLSLYEGMAAIIVERTYYVRAHPKPD